MSSDNSGEPPKPPPGEIILFGGPDDGTVFTTLPSIRHWRMPHVIRQENDVDVSPGMNIRLPSFSCTTAHYEWDGVAESGGKRVFMYKGLS